MAISHKDIINDRQWSASIGLKKEKFFELVSYFGDAYKNLFGKEIKERQGDSSNEAHLKTYEELLFFILFSLKCGLTYDALGLVFGMTGSCAKNIQTLGLKILKITLINMSMMPIREIKSLKEFKKIFPPGEPIFIDGTEQRTQRPENKEVVKEVYSGKKKIAP